MNTWLIQKKQGERNKETQMSQLKKNKMVDFNYIINYIQFELPNFSS